MPRNSSGTYSLPEAAFVPSTPISSTAVNSDFDDVADALTDSLSRTGEGGMQAALPLNVAGFFYTGDSDTGMSRSGANTQVITCGGTDVVEVTTTGANVVGTVDADAFTQNGVSLIPIGLGPLPWSGDAAPALWVLAGATYSRTTYAALWTFANTQIGLGNTFYGVGNGTTTFTIGTMDGYAPVGVDAAGTTLPSVTHVGDTTGNKTATLLTANLPPYTPAGSVSATSTANNVVTGTVVQPNLGTGAPTSAYQVITAGTAGQGSITSNGTLTGTAQGGTSTPVAIVQPSRAFKFIIYAGV